MERQGKNGLQCAEHLIGSKGEILKISELTSLNVLAYCLEKTAFQKVRRQIETGNFTELEEQSLVFHKPKQLEFERHRREGRKQHRRNPGDLQRNFLKPLAELLINAGVLGNFQCQAKNPRKE